MDTQNQRLKLIKLQKTVECIICGKNYTKVNRLFCCSACGGAISVKHYLKTEQIPTFLPFLPIYPYNLLKKRQNDDNVVALKNLGKQLKFPHLFAKLEFLNLTSSYKDRGSEVMITSLYDQGIKEIVNDSSGNAGASLSAFGARYGVFVNIFVPLNSSVSKIKQMKLFGSKVHAVKGRRQDATIQAKKFALEKNVPYVSHVYSYEFIEAMKAIAYEIVNSGINYTDVIVPLGNGSLLLGIFKGFQELKERNIYKGKIPKIRAVQASNCSPVYHFVNRLDWQDSFEKNTIAKGIAISSPPRLHQVADAISESSGSVSIVDEHEIVDARTALAENEGILCEYTSAVVLAGLKKLIKSQHLQKKDHILMIISGSGLKDM